MNIIENSKNHVQEYDLQSEILLIENDSNFIYIKYPIIGIA